MKVTNFQAILFGCPRLSAYDLKQGFSLSLSQTTCGDPRCRCRAGMLHPYPRLVVRDHDGRWRWIKLRRAEYELIAPLYHQAYAEQRLAAAATRQATRPKRPARHFSAAERALHAYLGLRWHNGRLEARRDFDRVARWQREYDCLLSRKQQRAMSRDAYLAFRRNLPGPRRRRRLAGQPHALQALATALLTPHLQETSHAT